MEPETTQSISPDTLSQDVPLRDVCQDSSPSTGSSNSTVCRICQLGRTETEKELVDIGCQCKGTLSMCHRECLVDWANAQQSAVCEICHTEYPGIVAQPVIRNLRHQRNTTISSRLQRCDTRRLWYILISFLLFIATFTSAALLNYVQTDYFTAYSDNIARSPVVRANYNFCFGLVLSIFLFCLLLLLAVVILWLFSECIIWPQQRRARRGHRFHMTDTQTQEHNQGTAGPRPRMSRSFVVSGVSTTGESAIARRTRTTSI